VVLAYHRASDEAEQIAKAIGDRALTARYQLSDVESAGFVAIDGLAGAEYYAAAKAALHGFSRSAAFSLAATETY
jgi:hypothetical protein